MSAVLTGEIPYRAVDRWGARNGVADADEFDRLWRIVHALDVEEVRLLNDKANKRSQENK